jgi:hypothetical protein
MPFSQFESTALAPQPIAGASEAAAVSSPREPYAVLDDLMSVIEVFCVVWPTRDPCRGNGIFLL